MNSLILSATMALMLVGFFMVLGIAGGAAPANAMDHSPYDRLLKTYVKDGLVDYAGFKQEEATLDAYLDKLADIAPDQLSADEQFAFYINAYNAWTIKLILTEYPELDSIKNLGSFFSSVFNKKFIDLDGDTVSLNHIEHDILRPKFGDPRLHFAVNCASISCPELRAEPYTADRLNAQLDDAARTFVNDRQKNYLEGNTLFVSRIFDWYEKDFKQGVMDVFLTYADDNLKKKLQARKADIRIKHLDYNWMLNDLNRAGE